MMQKKKKKKITLEKKIILLKLKKCEEIKTFCYSQTLTLLAIMIVCSNTHEIKEPIGQALMHVCMFASFCIICGKQMAIRKFSVYVCILVNHGLLSTWLQTFVYHFLWVLLVEDNIAANAIPHTFIV